jgi:hypothetical protein
MDSMSDLTTFLAEADIDEIEARLTQDLNRLSPEIGARGPSARGPQQPYVDALVASGPEVRVKTGRAVNRILSDESRAIDRKGAPDRSLLVFNALRLIQFVPMPQARSALLALTPDPMKGPLQDALRDRGEDLYRQLLDALTVHQVRGSERETWRRLLREEEGDYADVAVAGLRNTPLAMALESLAEVKDAYDARPDLGSFSLEVMRLVDEHPEANWPECARDFYGYDDPRNEAIWKLILKHAEGAFRRPLADLPMTEGSAASDLLERVGPQALERIANGRAGGPVSPAQALLAPQEAA